MPSVTDDTFDDFFWIVATQSSFSLRYFVLVAKIFNGLDREFSVKYICDSCGKERVNIKLNLELDRFNSLRSRAIFS